MRVIWVLCLWPFGFVLSISISVLGFVSNLDYVAYRFLVFWW